MIWTYHVLAQQQTRSTDNFAVPSADIQPRMENMSGWGHNELKVKTSPADNQRE